MEAHELHARAATVRLEVKRAIEARERAVLISSSDEVSLGGTWRDLPLF